MGFSVISRQKKYKLLIELNAYWTSAYTKLRKTERIWINFDETIFRPKWLELGVGGCTILRATVFDSLCSACMTKWIFSARICSCHFAGRWTFSRIREKRIKQTNTSNMFQSFFFLYFLGSRLRWWEMLLNTSWNKNFTWIFKWLLRLRTVHWMQYWKPISYECE